MGSLHKTMAQAIPRKSYLQCQSCASRIELNDNNKTGFLAVGWPKCCGYTMRLITPDPKLGGSDKNG